MTNLSPTVLLAQELIRRESITPIDAGCIDMLRARLVDAGFMCEAMDFGEVRNLWAVCGRAKPLVVFAGHTDVVPTGPAAQWRIAPFAGVVEDGVLHGRGAADMKGAVAAFVTACERFVARHPRHKGAVGLLITGDEEGVARDGTRAVIDALTARDVQIDMCIVGEPSCVRILGDTIKVGRRGSFGARLKIHGTQGHIAYPHDNPIHRAVLLLHELLGVQWDEGNDNFPPTGFQISNVHAGEGAANVIPGGIEIEFNLRYNPQSDEQSIRARIEQALLQHQCEYEIEWLSGNYPYETAPGRLIEVVAQCVHAATGVAPQRATTGGTSDGRFIAPTGAEVVEFGPLNATIHQLNECVAVADLDVLSTIYENVLVELLG